MLKQWLFAALVAGGISATGADYSKELAEIKAGQRTEARASWWGFDKTNATQYLQAALDSGVKKLIIDQTGSDWIIDPVILPGDQEIVLEKNVRIIARRGGFKGIRDSLMSAYGRKNIVIRGEDGAVIEMHKADYQDKKQYKPSEWRHAIALWGCENVVIRDLTIKSSGGDGIYLGANWYNIRELNAPPTQRGLSRPGRNILIENVICDDHHRQGISVISASNLRIRRCVLKNTRGTAPAAGIDFEPNAANEIIQDCIMEDCLVENNSGGGILVATEINTPVDLKIRRCEIIGGSRGISCTPPTDRRRTNPGKVEVTDCKFRDNTNSGIVVGNHLAKFYRITFRNCHLANSGTARGITPVSFTYDRPTAGMAGNVHFENVTVKTIPGRDLIAFKNWTPNTYLGDVTGQITADGKIIDVAAYIREQGFDIPHEYRTGSIEPAQLTAPPQPGKRRPSGLPLIRQAFNILIWGEAGKPVSFELAYRDMRQRVRDVPVTVTAPQNVKFELGRIEPGARNKFTFTPNAAGVYRLRLDIAFNMMSFRMLTSQAWSVMGEASKKGYVNFFKPRNNTRLYFEVPDGVKEFQVEVTGYPGETVTAAVAGPDGKVQAIKKDFDGPQFFTLKRDTANREIWSVTLKDVVEDVQLRFIEPLNSVFAVTPGNLLRSGK